MRKLTFLLALAAIAAAIVATTAIAATTSVKWKSHYKSSVTIKKGGTVRFVWADGEAHNVKGPGFRSKVITRKGATYSHTFTKRGTFKILCEVHPTTMKETVKVV
jgi:plastocyanin